jgi:hypothetical protein
MEERKKTIGITILREAVKYLIAGLIVFLLFYMTLPSQIGKLKETTSENTIKLIEHEARINEMEELSREQAYVNRDIQTTLDNIDSNINLMIQVLRENDGIIIMKEGAN